MRLHAICCVALLLASCRQSRPTSAALPTPTQVRAALICADVRSPYKSYVVGRLEPLGDGGFAVLFQPTDYRGKWTPVPFPLEGRVTNNGFVVYCLEQGEDGKFKPEGKAVYIPGGDTQTDHGRAGAR